MTRRSLIDLAAKASFASFALDRVRAASDKTGGRTPQQPASDEDFWFEVREAFSIDRNIINLNNGSVCPSPRVVQDAMQKNLEITQMQPSWYVAEFLMPHIELIRKRLAALFGCHPQEMAVTRNATESLEAIQLGLPLNAGDEVLTTTQDYPSMLITWEQRVERDGIVLKKFPFPTPPPSHDDLVSRFEQAITPRTKIIHFCHVTYTTGQIFPVKRICQMARQRGIETIVDGAHALAQFPYKRDDLDCDYYGASGHKWLSAPIGTGILYVRRDKIGKIWPLFASPKDMRDDIRKFESIGTFPVANRNAISEALVFLDSIGLDRKAARLQYLRERWQGRVGQIQGAKIFNHVDPTHSCALGAFSLPGWDAGKLVETLIKKYEIHTRPRFVPNEFECASLRTYTQLWKRSIASARQWKKFRQSGRKLSF
jgi:isopenicillin-N epimerase